MRNGQRSSKGTEGGVEKGRRAEEGALGGTSCHKSVSANPNNRHQREEKEGA